MKTVLILFACFLAWLQWECLPYFAAGEDAVVFSPPLLDGNGFTPWHNKVWPSASRLDPSGRGRYVYHGPIYPRLAWFLGRPASVIELVDSIAVRRALLPLAWLAVVLLLAVRLGQPVDRRFGFAVLVGQLFSFVIFARESWSRPEDIATLVLLLGAGAALAAPPWAGLAIGSVTVGVVTGINPWSGVVAGLVLATVLTMAFPAGKAVPRIAIAAAAAVVVFFLGFELLYPFSFAEWRWATGRMTQTVSRIPLDWPTSPNALYNASWLIAGGCLLVGSANYWWRRVAWPPGFAGLICLLLGAVWVQAVGKHRTYASATPAYLFFLVLPLVATRVVDWSLLNRWWRAAAASCLLLWAGYAIGQTARLLALRLAGDDVRKTVARFEALVGPQETLALAGEYFYLGPPRRAQVFGGFPVLPSRADVVVIGQSADTGVVPPVVPGFECLWHNFTPVGPGWWMHPKYFPMNRWAFYRRIVSSAP